MAQAGRALGFRVGIWALVAAGLSLAVGCGGNDEVYRAAAQTDPDNLVIDHTTYYRPLNTWLPQIAGYSRRHYGEDTSELQPIAVALHYTAGTSFPTVLVDEPSYNGERPGRSVHFVIMGEAIYQLLPLDARSRGAKGANHKVINIEMVARNEADLHRRRDTLDTAVALVTRLMIDYRIPLREIRSHQAIDRFDGSIPWVKDLVDPHGSGKPDPGESNMRYIKERLPSLSLD